MIVRFPDGDAVLRRIAAGQGREVAFAAITEVLLFVGQGVRLVGPLPTAVQNRTAYWAGLLAGAGAEARRFLDLLDAAPARDALARADVD